MSDKYVSQDDMKRMQQDAVRRVREMHARAKHTLERSKIQYPEHKEATCDNKEISRQPNQKGSKTKEPEPHMPNNKHKASGAKRPPCSNKGFTRGPDTFNLILEQLTKDKDKALILVLIVLLMNEKDSMGILLVLASLII